MSNFVNIENQRFGSLVAEKHKKYMEIYIRLKPTKKEKKRRKKDRDYLYQSGKLETTTRCSTIFVLD